MTLRGRPRGQKVSLYLDISADGRRWSEYLRQYVSEMPAPGRRGSREDRETLRRCEELRMHRLEELRMARAHEERCPKFYDYFEELIKRKKRTTAGSYHTALAHCRRYDPEGGDLSKIDKRWVNGFRKYLDSAEAWGVDTSPARNQHRALAESTKALIWLLVSAVFTSAVADGIISENPMRGRGGYSSGGAEREYLTIEEVKRLRCTPAGNPALVRAFLFSCLTGMRWSDVVKLRRDDVVSERGRWRIRFRQQKTGNYEVLDITAQAKDILDEQGSTHDDETYFHMLRRNGSVAQHLTKWMADAGIKKRITFHCARHTFAVMMLTLGVDLYTVSKLMGHTNIATTQIYAKIVDSRKQAAVDLIPEI